MLFQDTIATYLQQAGLPNSAEAVAAFYLFLSLVIGFIATYRTLPGAREKLKERGIYGIDINKTTAEERKEFGAAKRAAVATGNASEGLPAKFQNLVVPESLGIAVGTVYLGCVVVLVLCIGLDLGKSNAAISSIAFMLLLGFVDDVLDVRWRHKIVLSLLASLPLLMSYTGPTSIKVPIPLRPLFTTLAGQASGFINPRLFNLTNHLGYAPVSSAAASSLLEVVFIPLGPLYLLYMSLVCVFCTNSINILAGVNGVEVGQSIVVAIAQAVFCVVQIIREEAAWKSSPSASRKKAAEEAERDYWLSLTILIPFIGCSFALYQMNKYPSKVFVGDSYTYLAGMVLAVAGITGGYSKTLLLFFMPQLFNFIISLPQLFGIVECPRHRVPKWNKKKDLLESSGNLTILNAVLVVTGPLHESTLTNVILVIQALSCAAGFFIRFTMAGLVYENVH